MTKRKDFTPASATGEPQKPVSARSSYAKGQAKREEILTGVMEMLGREGYRNQTLRAIGAAVGIEPGHILYYFANREDLLQNVLKRWDRHAATLSPDDAPTYSSLDRLVAAVRRNRQMPGLVHLYQAFSAEAADPDHPAHEFFRRRFDYLCHALSQAIGQEQADGVISPDVDPDRAARTLIALADGFQLQALMDPQFDAVESLEVAVAQLRGQSRSSAKAG